MGQARHSESELNRSGDRLYCTQLGEFVVNVAGTLPDTGLDVFYRVSGLAQPGVDYTNIVDTNGIGKLTIQTNEFGNQEGHIFIYPY